MKVRIIVRRWPATSCRCARQIPNGTITNTKIDSGWIGLQGQSKADLVIQNELRATDAHHVTQARPIAR